MNFDRCVGWEEGNTMSTVNLSDWKNNLLDPVSSIKKKPAYGGFSQEARMLTEDSDDGVWGNLKEKLANSVKKARMKQDGFDQFRRVSFSEKKIRDFIED